MIEENTYRVSESGLLVGVRWPSNEMREQIVPVVCALCDERDKLYEDKDELLRLCRSMHKFLYSEYSYQALDGTTVIENEAQGLFEAISEVLGRDDPLRFTGEAI